MSFVNASPEYVAAAAYDLANIGSAIDSANSAAVGPTSSVPPAGADVVSASIAQLFGAHGEAYQALSAQAALFHQQFVELMNGGAAQYAMTEAANASPLQTTHPGALSSATNTAGQALSSGAPASSAAASLPAGLAGASAPAAPAAPVAPASVAPAAVAPGATPLAAVPAAAPSAALAATSAPATAMQAATPAYSPATAASAASAGPEVPAAAVQAETPEISPASAMPAAVPAGPSTASAPAAAVRPATPAYSPAAGSAEEQGAPS